jgi:spermidine/putrescine transport system permease protein
MNIINRKLGLKLNYFFVLLFIYLPIALMIVLSFNESKYFNQWTGFTFKWYQQLFENQNLISAFNNSVIVAISSTILSLVFGFGIALFMLSSKFTRKLKVLEEAASDLYANNIQVIKHITLPFVMPALLASVILSFILSFDEVVISMFVTGPGSTTLPVYVFSMIKKGVTPVVNSISSLMLIFSLILVSSVLVLSGKDDFK